MIDTVVVPLDGSPLAETALTPARALADRLDASLLLVTTHWADGTGGADAYLEQAAASVAPVRVDTKVVHDRFAADAIALEADRPGQVVCMATHGRGGIGQVVLGSVAEEVLRRSRAPLLLVGAGVEHGVWESAQWFAGGRVLVALDGSESSQAVLPAATDWARLLRLQLELVHVHVTPVGFRPGMSADDPEAAALEQVAAKVTGLEPAPVCTTLRGPDAATTLLEHAAGVPATLLALTTHGRTGLSRVTLGSVAMQVVRHSPCPALVVRSR